MKARLLTNKLFLAIKILMKINRLETSQLYHSDYLVHVGANLGVIIGSTSSLFISRTPFTNDLVASRDS